MSKRGRGSDKRSSRQPRRNMFRVSASDGPNQLAELAEATSASNATNVVSTVRQHNERRPVNVEDELLFMRSWNYKFRSIKEALQRDPAGSLIVTVGGTNDMGLNERLFGVEARIKAKHAILALPGVGYYRYCGTGATHIPKRDCGQWGTGGSFLTEAGEAVNIIAELIVNVIRCIKCYESLVSFPKRIYLDGCGSGAIAQALAAIRLGEEYPDIPLVLNLNDPVEVAMEQTKISGVHKQYIPERNYRLGPNVKIARINYAGSEESSLLRAVAINANGDAPRHFTFAPNTLVVASHFALSHQGIIENLELLKRSRQLLVATIVGANREKATEVELGFSTKIEDMQGNLECTRSEICAARNYGVGTWDYLQEPHEQYEEDSELSYSYQILKEDRTWRLTLGNEGRVPLPEVVTTEELPTYQALYKATQRHLVDDSASSLSKAVARGITIHKELAFGVFKGQAPAGLTINSSVEQVFAPIAVGEYYSCTPLPICCRAVAEKMQNDSLTQVLFTHLLFGLDDSKPANFWGLIVFCGHRAKRHCFVISEFLQLPPVAECIEDSFGSVSFLQSREYRGRELVLFVQNAIFNALAKAKTINRIEELTGIIHSAITRITQANEERPDAASVATAPPRRRRGLFSGLFRRRGGRPQRQRDQAETSESKTDGRHPL